MTDLRISALTDGSPLASGDEIAIARAGVSYRANWDPAQLPGHEIGYTQITSAVNIVSLTEASGTTILSPGALTFDGSPVLMQFWCVGIDTPSNAVNATVVVCLFEGSTQITRLIQAFTIATGIPRVWPAGTLYRFTPSAGSHTYTITAFASSTTGTPAVRAGAGGTGGLPPAFVRFIKV